MDHPARHYSVYCLITSVFLERHLMCALPLTMGGSSLVPPRNLVPPVCSTVFLKNVPLFLSTKKFKPILNIFSAFSFARSRDAYVNLVVISYLYALIIIFTQTCHSHVGFRLSTGSGLWGAMGITNWGFTKRSSRSTRLRVTCAMSCAMSWAAGNGAPGQRVDAAWRLADIRVHCTPLADRTCFNCPGVVESEVHVLLHYPLYIDNHIREEMLQGARVSFPESERIAFILSNDELSWLSAKTCKRILHRRNIFIYKDWLYLSLLNFKWRLLNCNFKVRLS